MVFIQMQLPTDCNEMLFGSDWHSGQTNGQGSEVCLQGEFLNVARPEEQRQNGISGRTWEFAEDKPGGTRFLKSTSRLEIIPWVKCTERYTAEQQLSCLPSTVMTQKNSHHLSYPSYPILTEQKLTMVQVKNIQM
jgi:hypothetical protein